MEEFVDNWGTEEIAKATGDSNVASKKVRKEMDQERRQKRKEEIQREMNYSHTSWLRKEAERWKQKKKCAVSLWTRCAYERNRGEGEDGDTEVEEDAESKTAIHESRGYNGSLTGDGLWLGTTRGMEGFTVAWSRKAKKMTGPRHRRWRERRRRRRESGRNNAAETER